MTHVPYETAVDERPCLGLIVLQADETIEDEFRCLFDPSGVRLHISRVPSAAELTPASIHAMKSALPTSAALFPEGVRFDAVAYACTSGTSLIGSNKVAELVRTGCNSAVVTNPLDAAFAALEALKASRIGIVSPYTAEIANQMRGDFVKAGLDVVKTMTFGEEKEANVARIASGSIVDAVQIIAEVADLDAVFLSCTNLRTLDAIEQLARDVPFPVLSSNLVLAWQMAKAAQVNLTRDARLPPGLERFQ
ncbi:MAG: Asp/Glu racemase [Pseudomonadota bacterium]